MSKQHDTINEKAKKIEVALKYTDGDMDKAKLMAGGKLQDVTVLKGKYVIPDQEISGFFLTFVNTANEYISAIRTVAASNNSIFTRLRVFDDWKGLFKNLLVYEKAQDSVDSGKLSSDLLDSFIKLDVFPDVQNQNLDYLSVSIQDIVKQSYGAERIKCQVELEQTNSMEVDLAGIKIMLPEPAEQPEEEPSYEQSSGEKTDFERRVDEIEERANFIVEGKSVLSPVKGVFVNEIKQGERIYVMLQGNDDVSSRILDAYKARDHEGQPLPVLGRLVDKISNEGKGYILYTLVAKGIYAKIIEEENVKVQTEVSKINQENGNDLPAEEKKPILSVLIYIVFVIMISGLIALLFML